MFFFVVVAVPPEIKIHRICVEKADQLIAARISIRQVPGMVIMSEDTEKALLTAFPFFHLFDEPRPLGRMDSFQGLFMDLFVISGVQTDKAILPVREGEKALA